MPATGHRERVALAVATRSEMLRFPAATLCTILVHNGVMRVSKKTVRQTVSLPATVATQVRSMAKSRRLSANRMLVELIENGMAAERSRQQHFFDLAERFRGAEDPKDVKRLGDELGRMVFGGDAQSRQVGPFSRRRSPAPN